MAAVSKTVECASVRHAGSIPSPSAFEHSTCASDRAVKVPGFQPGQAGSTPAGHSSSGPVAQWQATAGAIDATTWRCPLITSAWVRVPPVPLDSAGLFLSEEFRFFETHVRKLDSYVRNSITQLMRWGLCWYGQAALNRRDVGSIPTTAT